MEVILLIVRAAFVVSYFAIATFEKNKVVSTINYILSSLWFIELVYRLAAYLNT